MKRILLLLFNVLLYSAFAQKWCASENLILSRDSSKIDLYFTAKNRYSISQLNQISLSGFRYYEKYALGLTYSQSHQLFYQHKCEVTYFRNYNKLHLGLTMEHDFSIIEKPLSRLNAAVCAVYHQQYQDFYVYVRPKFFAFYIQWRRCAKSARFFYQLDVFREAGRKVDVKAFVRSYYQENLALEIGLNVLTGSCSLSVFYQKAKCTYILGLDYHIQLFFSPQIAVRFSL